jgi:TPR repeat protein
VRRSLPPGAAIRGFENLAAGGALAAALYAAMELDRLPTGMDDTEAAARWYAVAAERGSRAAGYRLGIRRTNAGDLAGAETAFGVASTGDKRKL